MQLVSKLFGRTLREAPSDAEMACHVWLARAGLIRRIAAGLYAVQPMGQRAIRKIEAIIRSEMEAIDGQELSLPLVQPSELWEKSGRLDLIGSASFERPATAPLGEPFAFRPRRPRSRPSAGPRPDCGR